MAKPKKISLKSMDVAGEKRERLKGLFPEVFNEGKVDFDQLKRVLGEWVEPDKERFGLNWHGKADCMKIIQQPSIATLKPAREESVNFDETENLFIEGDNLEVLKLLQKSYFGKVKMIYIDPPYNTGNEFIYPDNYAETLETYLAYTGQVDSEGKKFSTNTEREGRFHSNWLNMMYPRLYLARNLLREDGVIFISIDDNESPHLRGLCSQIFGEENFVAQLVWAAGRKNDSKLVSNSHEYIVCFTNNRGLLEENKTLWRNRKHGIDEIYRQVKRLKRLHRNDYSKIEGDLRDWFKSLPDSNPAKRHRHYSCVDKRGIYFPSDISWPGGGGPMYEVLHPITDKPCKLPSRGWMFSDPSKMAEAIADDKVHFGEDETKVPCVKSYLKDREMEVPYSVFYQDGRSSTKRLRTLMEGGFFKHPKDEQVLEELIEAVSYDDKDALILDFFAGSATTAHAVMQLNAENGDNRRFLCVQLPEPIGEKHVADKAGYKTIADIAKERIRRVAKKIESEQSGDSDLGFKVLKLAPSNFKVWNGDVDDKLEKQLFDHIEHIDDAGTQESILYELLLKTGFSLTAKVEKKTMANKEVFSVEGGKMLVCLDEDLNQEVIDAMAEAEPQPSNVICLDAGFKDNDQLKTNAVHTFKDRSQKGGAEIVFRTV